MYTRILYSTIYINFQPDYILQIYNFSMLKIIFQYIKKHIKSIPSSIYFKKYLNTKFLRTSKTILIIIGKYIFDNKYLFDKLKLIAIILKIHYYIKPSNIITSILLNIRVTLYYTYVK